MERTREFTMAAEELRNEPFDLQDEFDDVEIAEFVSNLVCKLMKRAQGRKNNFATFYWALGDYIVKAHNRNNGSFISISGDKGTGVSRSLVWIVDASKPSSDEQDVKNALEMLNEAYYLAIS